jgi:ArsR family metal-binding transcriptional regulator
MILQQAMMSLSKIENGVERKVNKLVMLWKEVGLCVHKSAYTINGTGYIISHFNSGKIVLKNIKTKEEAEEYLQELQLIYTDWTFTLEEWDVLEQEPKSALKEVVDTLQREIYNGK